MHKTITAPTAYQVHIKYFEQMFKFNAGLEAHILNIFFKVQHLKQHQQKAHTFHDKFQHAHNLEQLRQGTH